MARMISELGKPADIMASADFKVIDKNVDTGQGGLEYPFCHESAGACAIQDGSRYADQLTADNWYDILLKKGCGLGALGSRIWTPAAIAA